MKVVPECIEKEQPKGKYTQDLLDGKLYMYYMENYYSAIMSREIFEAVEAVISQKGREKM